MADLRLHVDTGAVTYHIYDADGEEIGKVKFTPTDTGIMERHNKVVEYLNSIEFKDDMDTEMQVVDLDKKICAQFDYLFGRPVSKDLFALAKPLTPLENGDYFFENVLDGIGDVIKEAYQRRLQKKLEKVAEATKEYQEDEATASDPA